jgi:hypothetical protein
MPSEAKNIALLARGKVGLVCDVVDAPFTGSVYVTTMVNTIKRVSTCQNLLDIFYS